MCIRDSITAELSKITNRQEKEIKAAMEEAGVKALEYDHKIYEAAGLSPTPLTPVSYTHLDVYKRQDYSCAKRNYSRCGTV